MDNEQDNRPAGMPPGRTRWEDPNFIEILNRVQRQREMVKLPIKAADRIVPRQKQWVIKHWIQDRQLTLIAGPPGSGKSTLACKLAAAVTKGEKYSLFEGLQPEGSGYVIYICQESDIETDLISRLNIANADLKKIALLSNDFHESDESPFLINSERDFERLKAVFESVNDEVAMIILDPVYQAVEGDFNNDKKAREAYEKLARMAHRLNCAIVGICHAVKNPQGKEPLARVAGPQALRQVPRSIILLSEILSPESNGGTHVMVHAKHNEGEIHGGYEYRLLPSNTENNGGEPDSVIFEFTKKVVESSREILEAADRKPSKNRESRERKGDIAIQFLRDILSNGEMTKNEIIEAALISEIALGTLEAAKRSLSIITRKRKGDGCSVWRLPDMPQESVD